jgi:hypothetical protein
MRLDRRKRLHVLTVIDTRQGMLNARKLKAEIKKQQEQT